MRVSFRTGVVSALLGLVTTTLAAQAPSAAEPDGAALYRQHCRSCHGTRGVPPARMIAMYPTLKTLADSSMQARLSVDSIATVVRNGKGKDMKAYADRLSASEIVAVAKFVKTLGSPAPAGPPEP